MNRDKKASPTSIGGQAVIEGIMMQGPEKQCIVVRKSDGCLEKEVRDIKKRKNGFSKLPVVRGCFSFVSSLKTGFWAINFSASFFDVEEENEAKPSKFEAFLEKKLGDKFNDAVIGFSVVLGILLAVLLFMLLPTLIAGFFARFVENNILRSAFEGFVRIAIFVGYIFLVSLMPDIKRVFSYHGAEHKTIACYEAGEELSVDNVSRHSCFHPRCGTSFLLIVMIVSIITFSFFSWNNVWQRMLIRILMLPIVAGISYEFLKLAGRHIENPIAKALSWPGLMLQRLTTNEPDSQMIEVAIESLKECIPQQEGADKW